MEYVKLWFYDVEIFPNFFSVTLKNKMTGKIKQFVLWEKDNGDSRFPYDSREEVAEIVNFFQDENKIFCGYNNLKYDNLMIAYLIYLYKEEYSSFCNLLKEESDRIIKGQNLPFDHSEKVLIWNLPYIKYWVAISLDPLEILRKGYTTPGSLKMVGIKLKHEKVQETFYDFNSDLKNLTQIHDTLNYNLNDVEITEKTFDDIVDQVELREELVENYSIKSLLTASDSKIAKTLFRNWYCARTKINYNQIKGMCENYKQNLPPQIATTELIFDDIEFKTDNFKESFKRLKNLPIVWYPEKNKYEFKRDENLVKNEKTEVHWEMNGVTYSFGLGGIHSTDGEIPGIFYPEEDEYILDADVSSQYPSVIRNKMICPYFLDADQFIAMFSTLIDERLEAKSLKKKLKKSGDTTSDKYKKADRKQASLKICINTGYGTFNDSTWIFYDPYASYKVTINCQLYLLMLVEDLELNGIKVISANTDGIIIRCKKDKYPLFQSIKEDWENRLNFELEETFYKKYVRKDVNNYIAQELNGDTKPKGCFSVKPDLTKGFSYLIVRKALCAHYLEGVDIMDYLKQNNNPENIYYFCSSTKVSSGKWEGCVLEKIRLYKKTEKKNGGLLANPKIKYIVLSAKNTQMINRWFISNPNDNGEGQRIREYKQNSDGRYQYNTFASNRVMTVFNDFFHAEKYNIDYDFYRERCEKVINQIGDNVNPM